MDELTRLVMDVRRNSHFAGLEDFIDATRGDLRVLCASLVDERTADDLVQETFVRAMIGLRSFRGDASARTWILSIARRACADEIRARSRRRRRDARVWDARPAVGPDVAEQVGVDDLLARLDPDRRAAFVLTQMLGLEYTEAAEVCGCPTGTIRSRVARARDDLVRMIGSGDPSRQGRTDREVPPASSEPA